MILYPVSDDDLTPLVQKSPNINNKMHDNGACHIARKARFDK